MIVNYNKRVKISMYKWHSLSVGVLVLTESGSIGNIWYIYMRKSEYSKDIGEISRITGNQ